MPTERGWYGSICRYDLEIAVNRVFLCILLSNLGWEVFVPYGTIITPKIFELAGWKKYVRFKFLKWYFHTNFESSYMYWSLM